MEREELKPIAKIFEALSSESRVAIALLLLKKPMRLNELARSMEADPSNLRKMLINMEGAGLVMRKNGIWYPTPLLIEVISSIRSSPPKKKRRGRWGFLIPPAIVFALAVFQAIHQNQPLYLVGGAMLALVLLGICYILSSR